MQTSAIPRRSVLISSHRPDWVVLAAAFTNVDGSEARGGGYAINEGGTANVAKSAENRARASLRQYDYVFDGTLRILMKPEDAVSPSGSTAIPRPKG